MKKTYITKMPDHIGAFLKASECLASLNINITRVSYNKVVDSHTLFIDAEGSSTALKQADIELSKIGYLKPEENLNSIVLIEFRLKDIPGSVTEVLKLINKFHFNISYISSQENGTDFQYFKMGLFIDDIKKISDFLAEAEKLCEVRIIDYNHAEKVMDNSIFYNSFVNDIVHTLNLNRELKNDLLINANLAMQTLDEHGLSPYKTFESISRFAKYLAKHRGEQFSPRITKHIISENTYIVLIEPPCGSNMIIIISNGEMLFIDSGYAIYKKEMDTVLSNLFDDFTNIKKKIFVTHADVDHCGLLNDFDEIIASNNTADCLISEYNTGSGFREQNPLHMPYIRMCKILTSYMPADPGKITTPWKKQNDDSELLTYIGNLNFGELCFDVYEGKGGHLKGETVLIEKTFRVAFTGDIYINIHGLTPQQSEYNQYAPILMTSVDTDSKLCAEERKAITELLKRGEWQIFGSHGNKLSLDIK